MPKYLPFVALIVAATFISVLPGYAQTTGQTTSRPAAHARVREEPCWQQVGISESAKQQRDAVASDRRSQVEAVCADTSLTPQQKQQKIHEIRKEAKQKIDALITPEQEQQLQACQKERSANRPSAPTVHHPGAGPCGELTSGASHAKPGVGSQSDQE